MEIFWAFIAQALGSVQDIIALVYAGGRFNYVPTRHMNCTVDDLVMIYAQTKELHLPRLCFTSWYDFELKV